MYDPVGDPKPSMICKFPKHRGELWTTVVEEDRDYVLFLLSPDCDVFLDRFLVEYLEDLLEETDA